MAREESELLYFSNKFKNGISMQEKILKQFFQTKQIKLKLSVLLKNKKLLI